MRPIVWLIAAAVLSGGALVVTAIALRIAYVMWAQLRAARAELAGVRERLEDAEASDEHALHLLDTQIQQRARDLPTFSAEMQDLRDHYDDVLRQLRVTHGITGPLLSRRIQ